MPVSGRAAPRTGKSGVLVNDHSSSNVSQEEQQQRAEEASEEEKRKEAEATQKRLEADLEKLQGENTALDTAKQGLEAQLGTLSAANAQLEKDKAGLERNIGNLNRTVDDLKAQIGTHENTIADLQRQIREATTLNDDNNLNPEYHGKVVRLVVPNTDLVATMINPVIFARINSSEAEFVVLHKVHPWDRKSAWTISRNGTEYLGDSFHTNGGALVFPTSRGSGDEARSREWLIAQRPGDPNGFIIKNCKEGKVLQKQAGVSVNLGVARIDATCLILADANNSADQVFNLLVKG
ncbi:hypothetical protein ASPZODRAFT_147704 [Penicilliopsis zonata CBS 506.65]|uniref:Uncharacterized protein n=1 Tax=Penicilliopsis zonata CBS 506.65 TaxID=1073090 RepID=A0A1L9S4U7_9EURO|nr:hypothetical protein ASPZODRAFT_147704 [Penicilliopsis zonata CBS 506.65]OJJ42177.1 hypothetical protein ASPZODRAFT_147704 [Penicilliopsis zonata CBS 506.65]